ncbi:MAG TPA: ABC transporter permease [Candidatus Methylomirabilis sp.]|nr:ABC transporter permease [Candidatus Methylomirabilis sp.]
MERIVTRGRAVRRWRDLVLMLAWRDIRIKYKQSVMGFLWAVLMPALVVGAGVAVQYGLSWYSGRPVDTANLAVVAVKSVPWAFFVASLRFATNSLIANSTLVTKVYLPREVFPVAAVLSQFADFCVASATLAVVLALTGAGASAALLWVPLLVAGLVTLSLGLGMFLSAGALFFRDVKYLVDVVITFAVFFTPVFYPVEIFGRYREAALLNPVAPLLVGLADAVVAHRTPDLAWASYSIGVSVACCVAGVIAFRRLEPLFAERI